MHSRTKEIMSLTMANLRKREKVNYSQRNSDSPESCNFFSELSDDEIRYSDLSISSSSGTDPGYLEVSADELKEYSRYANPKDNDTSSSTSILLDSKSTNIKSDTLLNLTISSCETDQKYEKISPEVPLDKTQIQSMIPHSLVHNNFADNHVSNDCTNVVKNVTFEDGLLFFNKNKQEMQYPNESFSENFGETCNNEKEQVVQKDYEINIHHSFTDVPIERYIITQNIDEMQHKKNNKDSKVNILSVHYLKMGKEVKDVSEKNLVEKHVISSIPNIDRVINNFGDFIQNRSSSLEYAEGVRPWTKKNMCPYCFVEVTHFPRHLVRNHQDEGAVKEFMSLPKNDPKRKVLLNVIRRQGNYELNTQISTLRPIRRPRRVVDNINTDVNNYVACDYCLGFFKKCYLRRHRKKCAMNKNRFALSKRINHLSETQTFAMCSGTNKEFYDSLRLRKEVFNSMRSDEISKVVMGDILICSYGENELKKHRRVQIRSTISNKMRELGRLLLVLREQIGAQRFIDILKPEYFDNIVSGTKIISGYDEANHTYKASSLALHMGTKLKQICDIATKLIIKKYRFLPCDQPEHSLKSIKQLRKLIEHHWASEISSLALKDLNEKHWEKPKLFPLTSDLMDFQTFIIKEANKACLNIKENKSVETEYRKLSECVLALTLLLNRKRIGEIQFLKLKTYLSEPVQNHQQEFLESLTESEKILTQSFKRVVTGGKGSRPVAILFPPNIRSLIETMLNIRQKCVPDTNEYLFANPKTENRWLSGYHTLKKLADQSGVKNKELFTSTRLRKQIATVLQLMNISDGEMEQFANFMGHTKKTHEEYYRLPQDVYQTAKVSKLLLAINKGKAALYKGKGLDEIEFSDNVESDDSGREIMALKRKKSIEDSTSDNESEKVMTSTSKRKIQRVKWTEMQKSKINIFFKDHIEHKIAPKKKEVDRFKNENKELFQERNWIKIKAYVYNLYRDRL